MFVFVDSVSSSSVRYMDSFWLFVRIWHCVCVTDYAFAKTGFEIKEPRIVYLFKLICQTLFSDFFVFCKRNNQMISIPDTTVFRCVLVADLEMHVWCARDDVL